MNEDEMSEVGTDAMPRKGGLLRLLPLVVLGAGLAAFFALDLGRFFTLETLQENRVLLKDLVAQYGALAGVGFAVMYAVAVAFSFPAASLLTIAGGFLLGLWWGTLWVVLGATLGATALFSAAKFGFGNSIRERMSGPIKRLEQGFQEDSFSYLLVLRLVPLFPFFLINLTPAFLGVSLRTFVLATFIGIIPGSFVYVSIGNGLGALFDAGETPNLGIIFQPSFLVPIIGLAVLALVPVIYKRFSRKKMGEVDASRNDQDN